MTICIAAIADNGQTIVTASDRLLSAPEANLPGATAKFVQLAPNCLALWAGDPAHEKAILEPCRRVHPVPVKRIAKRLRTSLRAVRQELIYDEVLSRYGLPRKWTPLDPGAPNKRFFGEVLEQMRHVTPGVEFLVVGVDGDGAHIYSIDEAGRGKCRDETGYWAIGSGSEYAITSLVLREYTRQTPSINAWYLAYEAKRRAELAPTVGKDVDLVCVASAGIGVCLMPPGTVKVLERTYEKHVARPERNLKRKLGKLLEAGGIMKELLKEFPPVQLPEDASSSPSDQT